MEFSAIGKDVWSNVLSFLDKRDRFVLFYVSDFFRETIKMKNDGKRQILFHACKNGWHNLIDWCLETEKLCKKCGVSACRGNKMQTLKYLHGKGCDLSRQCCFMAVKNNNLEMLLWLRNKKTDWDNRILSFAAEKGHLEMYKYLESQGFHTVRGDETAAASSGNMEMLEYVQKFTKDAMYLTKGILQSSLPFSFYREHFPPGKTIPRIHYMYVVRYQSLQYLKEFANTFVMNVKYLQDAISCWGTKEQMKWFVKTYRQKILAHKLPYDINFVKSLDPGILQFHSSCWRRFFCARKGKGEILQWLHENNCPFDPLELYIYRSKETFLNDAQLLAEKGYVLEPLYINLLKGNLGEVEACLKEGKQFDWEICSYLIAYLELPEVQFLVNYFQDASNTFAELFLTQGCKKEIFHWIVTVVRPEHASGVVESYLKNYRIKNVKYFRALLDAGYALPESLGYHTSRIPLPILRLLKEGGYIFAENEYRTIFFNTIFKGEEYIFWCLEEGYRPSLKNVVGKFDKDLYERITKYYV